MFMVGCLLIIIDISKKSVTCPRQDNRTQLNQDPYNQDVRSRFDDMWKDTSPWIGTIGDNQSQRLLLKSK